jgi:hypothetical protein
MVLPKAFPRLGSFGWLFLALSCSGPQSPPTQAVPTSFAQPSSRASAIDRASILSMAEAYADYQWTARSENAFHGIDSMGNVIDTPDQNFRPKYGWSLAGDANVGIPYQWGGASSLANFERGLAEGKFAGHIPTRGKSFWTSQAVGVDCSGLVSKCWRLSGKQSTRSLPKICVQLAIYDQLLPGDILNLRDHHTMIFVAFEGPNHQKIKVIESTARQGRVHHSLHDRGELEHQGYLPLRYQALAGSLAP